MKIKYKLMTNQSEFDLQNKQTNLRTDQRFNYSFKYSDFRDGTK